MTLMTRRALLRSTALVPVALALDGCAKLTSVLASLPQYAVDVQKAGALLSKFVLPALPALGLAGATLTKVEGWITQAESVAGTIGSAAAAGGTTLVSQLSSFAGAFNGIASTLGLKLPGDVGLVLQDVAALLPTILKDAGVNIALSGPATAAPMMSAAVARADMDRLLAS